jgi:hypothetical protein
MVEELEALIGGGRAASTRDGRLAPSYRPAVVPQI